MPRTGTGRVYQRGNIWWVQYGYRGETHRESSRSTKKKDAVDLLRRRLEEMGRGQLVGPSAERILFEDLVEMIETDYRVNKRKSSLKGQVSHLESFFGLSRAIDITTDRITAYIAYRQEEGAANATIQNELAALKRMFSLATRAGRLPSRPYIPSLKVRNTREGFFESAELERLLAALPAAERAMVEFAALTGWRKAEVTALQWSQVDFEAGVVRLAPGSTKNDEGREFPFRALPPLEALLVKQQERTRALEREQDRIIPNVFHRKGRPIREIRTAWAKATKAAGLEGWLFHDLRRTAVRNLERAGVPRSVAMKLTGHKTEAVYRRYAIADAAALAEGVEKLARLHAEPADRKVIPMAANP